MLAKLGEWYQIAALNPKHEDLERRKKSIESIVQALKTRRKLLTIEAVAGLAWHLVPDWEIVEIVVEAIRENDLTFSTALRDNELELQVITGIVLGEVMDSSRLGAKTSQRVAICLKSALGIPRNVHSESMHYSMMLQELTALAIRTLDREAIAIRNRPPMPQAATGSIKEVFQRMQASAQTSTDHRQLWTNVSPALEEILEGVQAKLNALEIASRMDREELEALWWVHSGRSKVTGSPFAKMSPGAAALCTGWELAGIYSIPPLPNACYLLEDILSTDQEANKWTMTLKEVVSDWELPFLSAVQHDSNNTQDIVQKYPAIFPISWIVGRLVDSQMTTDWTAEFETRTGIRANVELTVSQWAEHVMWEQVAQKVYQE